MATDTLSLSSVVILLLWAGAVVLGFLMPYMVFSAVRNIKRSRVALERIADALESPTRTSGAGVLGL